jgi:hypothetical protein
VLDPSKTPEKEARMPWQVLTGIAIFLAGLGMLLTSFLSVYKKWPSWHVVVIPLVLIGITACVVGFHVYINHLPMVPWGLG